MRSRCLATVVLGYLPQVIAAVLNAHATHATGRAALDGLQHDIESAVATRTDLDTPAGARAFQRYLIGKLRDIRTVVETYARERSMHFVVGAAPSSLAGIAARLPRAVVAEGANAVQLDVRFDPALVSAAEVLSAVQAEVEVVDIRIDEPAIEDVVRRMYAGEL